MIAWTELCTVGSVAEFMSRRHGLDTEHLGLWVQRNRHRSKSLVRQHVGVPCPALIHHLVDLLHVAWWCSLDEHKRQIDQLLLIAGRERDVVAQQRSEIRHVHFPAESLRPQVQSDTIWRDVSADLEVDDRTEVRRHGATNGVLGRNDHRVDPATILRQNRQHTGLLH